jgi:hypothetical protein
VIGWLVVVVLVALAAVAVLGLVETARNRPPGVLLRRAVGAVVALLAVQAAIAAVRVLSGVQVPETTQFLIYLAVSVAVLPIALQWGTAAEEGAQPSRWGGAVVAVGAGAVAVAVLRTQGLWAAAGA